MTDTPMIKELSEDQMMHLVRNTLLVAGDEMGADGDHWPVIKSTILELMKEWEQLKVERNVHAEMKMHLGYTLAEMEKALDECPEELRDEMKSGVKELREVYEAYFSAIDGNALAGEDVEMPIHVKRAEAIIDTFEENER